MDVGKNRPNAATLAATHCTASQPDANDYGVRHGLLLLARDRQPVSHPLPSQYRDLPSDLFSVAKIGSADAIPSRGDARVLSGRSSCRAILSGAASSPGHIVSEANAFLAFLSQSPADDSFCGVACHQIAWQASLPDKP